MSFLVKKKRTIILSKPEGSNSIIRKIGETKVVQERKSGRGRKQKTYTATVSKKQFLYEFFFQVDMRKVLQNKIYELEYVILSAPTVNSPGFFRGLGNINPTSVTSAFYSKRKQNQKVISEDMHSKFIGSGKISLMQNVNAANFNGIPDSLKGKTDAEIFGKVKKNKLVDVNSMKKKGRKETMLSQTQTSTVDYDRVYGDRSFYYLYRDALNKHVDPGEAFLPIDNLSSPTPDGANSIIKNNLLEKDYSKSACLNSIRSKFENIGDTPLTTIGEIYNKKPRMTSITVEEPNRVQTIMQRFKILEEKIGSLNSFIIRVRVKDPATGLFSESLDLLIQHKVNVDNYYIPDSIPTFTAIRTHQRPGINGLTANFGNINNKIHSIRLAARKINDDQNLHYSRFTTSRPILEFDPIRNQSGFKYERLPNISMHQQAVVRAMPVTLSGERLSNFTSDVATGESFHYVDCNINAVSFKDTVKVDYSVDSDAIAGCSVYKKRHGEKEYTPLNYHFESTTPPGTESISMFSSTRRGIDALSAPGSSTAFQSQVRSGMIITYKLRLFLKNGGDFFSNKSSTVLTQNPSNAIKIIVGTIFTSNTKSLITSRFNIDYEVQQSSTSQLLEILREIGNEGIFSQEVDILKSRLNDIALFGIVRTNISTSEEEFLGYHKAGEFIDNGSGWKPLQAGMAYRYTVTAYLANMDQIEKSFQVSKLENKNVISRISDINTPSNISKIQNAVLKTMSDAAPSVGGTPILSAATSSEKVSQYNLVKLQKSISPISLGKGIISSNNTLDQDYRVSTYNTGDTGFKILNLSEITYNITGMGNTVLTRSNSGSPVLRFSLTAEGFSDLSTIDQIVITCERNNQESICGSCHNDGTGKFVFVDFTSKDYIGDISYFASIITVSGKVIGKKLIASSTLRVLYPNTLMART